MTTIKVRQALGCPAYLVGETYRGKTIVKAVCIGDVTDWSNNENYGEEEWELTLDSLIFYAHNQYSNESFPILNQAGEYVTSKEEAQHIVDSMGADYVLTTGWQTVQAYPFS